MPGQAWRRALPLVVLGVLLAAGCGDDGGDGPGEARVFPAPHRSFGAERPTWAVGTTVHYGSQTLDLPAGPPVAELLRSPYGFFVSRAENGGVAEEGFFDGEHYTPVDGGLRDLALSEDGTYAAWAAPAEHAVVVVDLRDGTRAARFDDLADVSLDPENEDPDPPATQVLGFDGDRLWFRDEESRTFAADVGEWEAVATDGPAPEATEPLSPLVGTRSPDGRFVRDFGGDGRLAVVATASGAAVWRQAEAEIEADFLSWTDDGFLVSVSDGYVTEPGTHYLVRSCDPAGCSTVETVAADQRVVGDGWSAG